MNTCKGILKIRGSRENISAFLKGSLIPINQHELKIFEKDDHLTLRTKDSFYIKGSADNYIDSAKIQWHFEEILMIRSYIASGTIDAEALAALSAEFQVDLKIYGFEHAMEFTQDVEVIKGEIIRNTIKYFENYIWECVDPDFEG